MLMKEKIRQVSCGEGHSLALTDRGHVSDDIYCHCLSLPSEKREKGQCISQVLQVYGTFTRLVASFGTLKSRRFVKIKLYQSFSVYSQF